METGRVQRGDWSCPRPGQGGRLHCGRPAGRDSPPAAAAVPPGAARDGAGRNLARVGAGGVAAADQPAAGSRPVDRQSRGAAPWRAADVSGGRGRGAGVGAHAAAEAVPAGAPALRWLVATKLARKWSPQQIAGWLTDTFPDAPELHVSHETIYRSLFVQSRGGLKRELITHLRRRPRIRRARQVTTARHRNHGIPDAISIRERPAEAADRAVPGHWEGDLLTGGRHSHIATLVERHSRFVVLVRLASKDTTTVVTALTTAVRTLPEGLMTSLTWDRGRELAAHKRFTVDTHVQVYFCDPQSPWQRGTNENTNGLLRQYFPKGTDLSRYSQRYLDAIARELNTRPRKTLGYRTPADILAETVAPTD